MNRRTVLFLLTVVACAAFVEAAQRRNSGRVHTVVIDATSFSPAKLTIRPGDRIVWRNRDIIPHTATSAAKGGFDSGTLAPGDSWKRTFRDKGTFAYICTFHPTMKGTVVVSP